MVKKGIYRHFKGSMYLLEDIAKDSETLEELVVYRALYDDFKLWVRPLKMWEETVKKDQRDIKRFEFILDIHEEDGKIKNILGDVFYERAIKYIKRLADND